MARLVNKMFEERKRIEDELKKKEAYQQLVLDSLPMAFYITSPDSIIGGRWVSEQIYKLTGYRSEQFLGDEDLWAARIHPQDRKSTTDALTNMSQNGPLKIEYRWQTASGIYIWIEDHAILIQGRNGVPAEIIGTWRDITKRRKSDEALKLSEATLRSIAGVLSVGIGQVLNQVIKQANDKLCAMTGYSSEALIGQNVRILYPSQEEFERVGREYCSQIREKETGTVEARWQRKDGTIINVLMSSTPVDRTDQEAPVIFTVQDMSEQKTAKTERKDLENLLRQSQKMEAIGTLAGGIAHDFNNILSPILIQTELALMDLPQDSLLRFNLEDVLEAAHRARELVKRILAFSRQSDENHQPVEVKSVIADALKLLRATLPTTIRIEQQIESKSDTILADSTQIYQILMNLGTNASHAMRANGGILKVILEDVEIDMDEAVRRNVNPGPYLKLSIADTGCGMGQEVMGRIFDPYFTTKEKGEGSGLGLAVVHGIVKGYGGAIVVESETGSGTVFEVFLPQTDREMSIKTEEKGPMPRGDEKILVVDDEKAVVDATQQILERLGYDVVARTSSREALEVFCSQPDMFDLVLTDQTMPNMTGVEFAGELMALRKDIPVILFTGFSETIDEEKAKSMGIVELIMKPLVMREMAEKIRNILDNR
jgi:PAS domain S-box-containing protein